MSALSPAPSGTGKRRVPPSHGSEAVTLTSADGLRLVAVHLRSTAVPSSAVGPDTAVGPDATRTAIVIAHGFGGTHDQERVDRIARLMTPYAGVIAVTQRGHGASAGRTTLGHREPMDIEAATLWARDSGYDRVVTVGFSMGAAVVLRHAALLPRAQGHAGTDAVVAVSGPAFWSYRGTPPMRWLHRGIATVSGRAVIRAALGARVDPAPWPEPPPLPPTDAATRVREHGLPLLIVHGDADAFFPLDHPRALHSAAPGSDLWMESGFGHAEGAISEDLVRRIGEWAVGDGAPPAPPGERG